METVGFTSISSYQGLHSIMYQKRVIFTVIAAKMSNITSATQLLHLLLLQAAREMSMKTKMLIILDNFSYGMRDT